MLTSPTGQSLARLAADAWERWGEDTTTVFEGARWTSAELGRQARAVAGGLAGLGVRPGDRVVVLMANCPEVTVSYQAVWWLGAVTTPVLFLVSEDELRHVLVDSEAVVVVTTPEFTGKVLGAARGVVTLRHVVVAGEPVEGTVAFADLVGQAEAAPADVDPTGLGALLYTGGTTGRSKGVMLSHDALSAAAWASTLNSTDPRHTVSILPLPLAHVFGLMVSTMGLHATQAGTTVLMRWFEPAAYLRLVAAEGVHVGPVVPAMLRSLLTQPLEEHDLSTLQRLSSGSAPLAEEVVEQLARRLPQVEVAEGYGCTETAALISSTPLGAVRRGSVGRPVHGISVRITAPDGREVPTGEDGEICVQGPSLMQGYWRAPDATVSTLRDGWLHTGDVGRVDADGYLYVVDRIKDLIIRGGFNVYPRDVEEVLMAHPDIANAAVVGRPDDVHGEEVVAYVQPAAGATLDPDAVRAYAREHLSAVKYPREVHVVEQIPLTSVGKLDRKRLRAYGAG
ncbi:class I adenylate-forming enzyme family protein [Nocardioides sp. AX2bis]|uniref:class I adenylate-forming enzyme family protein n=1 Tax=Nocardioides sp. AX2bis TaxID=2653157 RepID=UPI00135C968B|nr:AMP-binding protein [Nocardioides sp. AX2bis]